MKFSFSAEPALYVGFVTALLDLAIGFGLPVSGDQRTLLIAVITLGAGVLTRSLVTPVSKVPEVAPVVPAPVPPTI